MTWKAVATQQGIILARKGERLVLRWTIVSVLARSLSKKRKRGRKS